MGTVPSPMTPILQEATDPPRVGRSRRPGDLDAMWWIFINYEQFETVNRKFRYHLSTNGYEVSLGYERKQQVAKNPKQAKIGLDAYDTLIGIDPGRTFLYTAYSISKLYMKTTPNCR